VVIYAAMVVLLRLGGKREIGQLTPFDVVVLLMIGNAIQNGMVGPDDTVTGSLEVAASIIAVNYLVARVGLRSVRWRAAVRGEPTVLVSHGQFLMPNLRKESIDPDEVRMAMREHGIDDLHQVKLAVFETDGSISIVPESSATVIIPPTQRMRYLRHQ
jgi:uncharacterized membrane protein YcaP (DUF421 family)